MKSEVLGLLLIAASLVSSPALAQTAGSETRIPQPAFTIDDAQPPASLEMSTVSLPAPKEAKTSRLTGPTIAMYAAYGMVQALDAHSTLRALDGRGAEGNPFVRPFASSPARLVSFKAASAAGVLYLAQRLRKKNQVAALALMVGVTSLQTYVVVHNYRVAHR